jgi:isochorismate hydrolase
MAFAGHIGSLGVKARNASFYRREQRIAEKMNTVIDLARYLPERYLQILVLVDVCHSDPYFATSAASETTSKVLANCRKALAYAREKEFPVAFFRKSDADSAAHGSQSARNWLPGLEPQRSDMVFERAHNSCYDNQAFGELMGHCRHKLALVGLGDIAFFATAVDAYRREHDCVYLRDATISTDFGDESAAGLQRAIVKAVSFFGRVSTTRKWTQRIPRNLVLVK